MRLGSYFSRQPTETASIEEHCEEEYVINKRIEFFNLHRRADIKEKSEFWGNRSIIKHG